MVQQIQLGQISIDVTLKNIKNVHLSVHPPAGKVKISAPLEMDIDTIRTFAISKLDWIKKERLKFEKQIRETPREFLACESHHLWGERYLLSLIEHPFPPRIEISHKKMLMYLRPGGDDQKKQVIIETWYREQLKAAIPELLQKWEKILQVKAEKFSVRKMKTRWGSSSPAKKTIRLNLELAKKPPECLEYIVVHELVHLLEPTHNQRFKSLMNKFMPKWRFYRDELNLLPLKHENWAY